MAKRGRPKGTGIKLDFDLISKCAKIHCTIEEIASFLGVSHDTLNRSKEFLRIYKKGMHEGKMSLRRMQFKSAEEGNVTSQIWLGKQLLGQRDKQDIAHEGDIKIKINLTDD
jgi:hypothetical protein